MRIDRGVSACFFLSFFVNFWAAAEQEPVSTDRFTSPILEPIRITAEHYVKQQPADMRMGNDINFIVKLSWQGRLDAVEVSRPAIPELEGLRYLYVAPSNGVEPEAGRAWSEFNYLLEPQRPGKTRISELEISYIIRNTREQGTLRTEPLEVNILSAPIKWSRVLSYAGIVVVGIFILSGATLMILTLARRRTMVEEEPEESPYERLRAELSSIKMYLVEGETKNFYDKLVKLAKRIVSLDTGEEVGHLTTEEMTKYLESKAIEEGFRQRLVAFLQRADNVRYGGYLPSPPENEMALKEIRELIDQKIQQFSVANIPKEDR